MNTQTDKQTAKSCEARKSVAGSAPETRTITQDKWDTLTDQQREAIRDYSGISPQLRGLEGYRVEVVTDYDEKRRFIVGRSTGWRPCSLEIHNRRCLSGPAAEMHYKSVITLYKAR